MPWFLSSLPNGCRGRQCPIQAPTDTLSINPGLLVLRHQAWCVLRGWVFLGNEQGAGASSATPPALDEEEASSVSLNFAVAVSGSGTGRSVFEAVRDALREVGRCRERRTEGAAERHAYFDRSLRSCLMPSPCGRSSVFFASEFYTPSRTRRVSICDIRPRGMYLLRRFGAFGVHSFSANWYAAHSVCSRLPLNCDTFSRRSYATHPDDGGRQ